MSATLPPRWFIRTAWTTHRALLRVTGNRVGLSAPRPGGRFGMLRLHTIGRRSQKPRAVVLGYIEDGDRLVTLAMNGWDPAEPAWWLNLRDRPTTTVDLVTGSVPGSRRATGSVPGVRRATGSRRVTAYEATGDERDRLWDQLRNCTGYGELDALAERRGRPTAVVVLRPPRADETT